MIFGVLFRFLRPWLKKKFGITLPKGRRVTVLDRLLDAHEAQRLRRPPAGRTRQGDEPQ